MAETLNSPPATPSQSRDDAPTLASLGALAFALANIAHETLGHVLTALAIGGKVTFLSTCYVSSSGHFNLWVPAAGGLMNLAIGLLSLAAARRTHAPTTRLFLILLAAFNLFFAFGYPAYSGLANFGDWAVVTAPLHPQWLWRTLLVLISVAGYYSTMRLLLPAIAPFASPQKARLHRLTLTPYLAAIAVACAAGALNPGGWRTMLSSGLPAAAAAFGLTQLDHWPLTCPQPAGPIRRSYPWILAAAIVAIFFIAVLGPGIHFS